MFLSNNFIVPFPCVFPVNSYLENPAAPASVSVTMTISYCTVSIAMPRFQFRLYMICVFFLWTGRVLLWYFVFFSLCKCCIYLIWKNNVLNFCFCPKVYVLQVMMNKEKKTCFALCSRYRTVWWNPGRIISETSCWLFFHVEIVTFCSIAKSVFMFTLFCIISINGFFCHPLPLVFW